MCAFFFTCYNASAVTVPSKRAGANPKGKFVLQREELRCAESS